MFDTLVYGKDAQIPGSPQPATIKQALQLVKNRIRPITVDPDPFDEVGSRSTDAVSRNQAHS